MNDELKYYCDKSFKKDDDEKWYFLIQKILYKSDYVEFNVLKKDYKRVPEISVLSKYLIEEGKKRNKLFSSDISLRFLLDYNVKEFILSKKYIDWYNYYLEDISFLQAGKEILATLTHENYVVMLLTENQKDGLNNQGFNFSFFISGPLNSPRF